MSIFVEPLSELIWDAKYRHREADQLFDLTIEDTWQRVAKAIANGEKPRDRKKWQALFYQHLAQFRFIPGGRILAGAGTKHRVTLFNCFVMDITRDSLPAIFNALKEGAITLQQGGGVGYDFSVLRPRGEEATSVGVTASGPVSFMRIWDTACSVLVSTGARRGAMMGVMRCDHPDIEEFIAAKANARELRHFNVSVMVSDAFMEAVKNNNDWPLIFPAENSNKHDLIIYRQWGNSPKPIACKVYKHVNARKLWEQIIRAAYEYAEPGVLFSDTINTFNNLRYCEQINATNPCGEIPLPAYGACNLGAINLTQFITDPFTKEARINWQLLDETTALATRFLDDVIEVSRFPLKTQERQAKLTRRIGLGLTGLADALVMLGVRYGSDESIGLAKKIMKQIAETTWLTSIELAQEKGRFPAYTKDFLHGNFVQTLPPSIRREIAKSGVRNSHHNTIAPAGTISLLANNISNGIEPIYQAEYKRRVRLPKGAEKFQVKNYAFRLWQTTHESGLPPAWTDIHSLHPNAHLEMQSAMQGYIDNAISKTINIPRDFPFGDVENLYTKAHELGLKGCTIFRPNEITGSVILIKDEEEIDQCC